MSPNDWVEVLEGPCVRDAVPVDETVVELIGIILDHILDLSRFVEGISSRISKSEILGDCVGALNGCICPMCLDVLQEHPVDGQIRCMVESSQHLPEDDIELDLGFLRSNPEIFSVGDPEADWYNGLNEVKQKHNLICSHNIMREIKQILLQSLM